MSTLTKEEERTVKGKGSILVIDDDPRTRGVIHQGLEDEGYCVVEAATGQEGVDLYKQHPADLVITNLFMGEKGGLEVMTEILSYDPQAKIVAIADSYPHQRIDLLRVAKTLGACRTFLKPIDLQILLRAIAEELGGRPRNQSPVGRPDLE